MSTIVGKKVAVQIFHRRLRVELPMKNQIFRVVNSGLARETKLHGTASSIWRSISWMILKLGIRVARKWGEGGQVSWLNPAVSYFIYVSGIGNLRLQ